MTRPAADYGCAMSVPRISIVLALVALAAGCGGGSAASKSGGGSSPAAARAFPEHALAFVDVNLDRDSAAWKRAEAVGARFPSWPRFVARVQALLNRPADDGGSYRADVAPWLGDEAAFAVTGIDVTDQANPVDFAAYAAVKDAGRLRGELLSHHYPRARTYRGFDQYRSNDGQSYIAVADDAVLAANTEAGLHSALDALSGASPSLADSQRYRHAIAGLPTSRLVTAYADATQVGRLVSLAALGGTGPAFPAAPMARLAQTLHEAGSITASLGADSGGVRLTMNATPDPGRTLPQAFLRRNAPPVLAADVPADAFAYAGGQMGPVPPGFGGPGQAQSMRAFARLTGLSWKRDIAPLLSDTLAAYAAPGLPVTGALLLHPRSPGAAAAAMRRITAALHRLEPDLRVRDTPDGQRIAVGPGFAVSWRRAGDVIAVSNDPAAGEPQSPSLTQGAGWRSVARLAGVPDRVGFLAYLNTPALMRAFPVPPDPDAAHLGSLVAWSTSAPGGAHFVVYLQVLG